MKPECALPATTHITIIDKQPQHNISPLHVAAKWGNTNLASLLLEKGANIESKNRDGLTALHCAARSGHEQVVDMMLERGAPISSKTKEQMKSDKRTLQDLQPCAGIDKENLVGGGRTLLQKESLKPDKEAIGENSVFNKPKVSHKRLVVISNKKQKKAARGKDKAKVTVEDLTSNDSPSEDYWCVLAEKRRLALEEALEENMKLHEKIALLEEENSAQKIILEETNGVLNVLREMVGDVDDSIMSDVSNAADTFYDAATEDLEDED